MRIELLCISVLRVASGPRVKLASCKSALNPPVVYSTDRSKAVVPVLVLLFVALWFVLRGDVFNVLPCVTLLFFSVPLALRLPRLGKSVFRTFVRFVLLWICRFPLPLGVWEGQRFVIVAFPGLFSYLVLQTTVLHMKRLNQTESPISPETLCSLFPKAILFYFYSLPPTVLKSDWLKHNNYFRRTVRKLTYDSNKHSNQPVHLRSLIRIFLVRINKLCILGYPKCSQ